MRDGWREIAVGDVAQVVGGGTPKSGVADYWDGDIPWLTPADLSKRPSRFTASGDRSITDAGLAASSAKMLPAGSVLLSTRAPVGYVTVASAPIATNQGFRSLILDDDQLPEFWYYLLLHSTDLLVSHAGGSTFKELSGGALKALRFRVPPLDEQRRIVDLIAAVDAAVDAADAEADGAAALLAAALDASVSDETSAIGSLASIVSGASWGKADVRTDSGDGVTSVLTIANTKPDGSISGEPTLVHGLSARVARLTESSLIAIRTNGNHDRIGNVYRVPEENVGAAVSAFQFVVEPNAPADSEYLHWMMRAPSFQAAVTSEASGSTGLGNIAASKLREMHVPWPTAPEVRASRASTFASIEAGARSARATADALRTLRSNLLTVLLSGEHEIPSSYDALLEEVA